MAKIDSTARALRKLGPHDGSSCRVHSVSFSDPESTLRAATQLHAAGFEIVDVHSPFPIHGIEAALGWRDTRLPWATFVGGVAGVATGLSLALYIHAVSWPLNIGGKTDTAIPAMIPVVFELGVLFAAFASLFALLFRRRLWPRRAADSSPGQPSLRVNDDDFVILVLERDGAFSGDAFRAAIEPAGPTEVIEGWKVL